jgi:hypothetical protein
LRDPLPGGRALGLEPVEFGFVKADLDDTASSIDQLAAKQAVLFARLRDSGQDSGLAYRLGRTRTARPGRA